jgi:hypothetical protein
MWETLSGSIFLPFANPGYYDRLLDKTNAGSAQALRKLKNICIGVCLSLLDVNLRRVLLPSAEFRKHILSRIPSWDIVK